MPSNPDAMRTAYEQWVRHHERGERESLRRRSESLDLARLAERERQWREAQRQAEALADVRAVDRWNYPGSSSNGIRFNNTTHESCGKSLREKIELQRQAIVTLERNNRELKEEIKRLMYKRLQK